MESVNIQTESQQSKEVIIEKTKNGCPKQNRNPDEMKIMEEEEILPFVMNYLTPSMQDELENILKETKETREKGLTALKERISMEKNLNCRMDENFLLQFLRCKKYDVKKAFKMLQNFYSFKKENLHIFDVYYNNPQKTIDLFLRNYAGFLRSRDRLGSAIFIAKAGLWDYNVDSYEDMFGALSGAAACAIEYPPTQVCGYRVIADLRQITWRHMKYCTPHNVYLIIRSTQYCFPGRCKGVHVLTENKLFNLIWSIAYPILTKKIRERVHFHGNDLSGLQEFIHPSVLPVEFGGQHPSFENTTWIETINCFAAFQKSVYKYGYK